MGANFDGLFPKVLKTLGPYITPTLSRISNLSLQNSPIPDDWLQAIVAPIAKAPRTAHLHLFRPISLTSAVCKVHQTILKEKMLGQLSQFSFLASRQHGFLPRRSTQAHLLVAEELITKKFDEGLGKQNPESTSSRWHPATIDQELADLLKQTFQGFYRKDKRSTPTLHARTEIRMANPHITDSEA